MATTLGEYVWVDTVVSAEEFRRRLREVYRAFLRLNRAYKKAQSGPPPLCINGHEYHRRQRRRVKRSR